MARSRGLLAALVGLLACCAFASAQTQLACNITEVKVEQLSNAVEVTLKADGLLRAQVDFDDFFAVDENDNWNRTPIRSIPVRLTNAQSQVGTFVDVGTYPVSYVELTTPAEEREAVGLDVQVVLYEPAIMHYFDVDNAQDWEWGVGWGTIAFDIRKSRDGRSLSILVWSDRHEDIAAPPKPRREQSLPVELSVEFEDGLLTVHAVNAPLEELASTVARATGATVYVDDRVQRLATVEMSGVPIDRFIRTVAAGYGLSVTQADGAWLVSDGLPTSLAPWTAAARRIWRLDYVEAPAAIKLLPNFLLRYLRPSDTGDAIVAYGPPALLDRIGEDLAAIDRPTTAIAVRTAVVEATDNDSARRLWRLIGGGGTNFEIDGRAGAISIRRDEERLVDWLAEIRALDTARELRVHARPSLEVEPGKQAEIFVGQRQYFQFAADPDNVQLRSTDAGVRLMVRPRPMGAEMISTRVEVSVSTFRGVGSEPPVVDSRSAACTLAVGAGDTLVVGGGLVMEDSNRSTQGPKPFREIWRETGTLGALSAADQIREIVFLVSADYVRPRPEAPATEEQS